MVVFVDYATYASLRDSKVHTNDSLAELDKRARQLVRDIPVVFPTKNWCIPKFYQMRFVEADIRSLGNLDVCDTGPRERKQKDIRNSYHRVKRHYEGLAERVGIATTAC